MQFKKVKLADASRKDLVTVAVMHGLEVDKQDKPQLIALLKQAGFDKDEINVIVEAPKAHEAPSGDVLTRSEVCVWDGNDQYGIKRARRLIHIQIPNQDRPGGDREVAVGINGTHLFIARNTPSLVPEEYVESLSHAVETKYDPSPDPEQPLSTGRFVQRYPFQRVPIADDSVLVKPNGQPYEKATAKDVAEYKAKRMEAEIAEDQRLRKLMREKGMVA